MAAPRPTPHPVFTAKLCKDVAVPRLSFSELATGLYDVLHPLIPSEDARFLMVPKVTNMALVCLGLRQACFISFWECFHDELAARMGGAGATALGWLEKNGAIDGKRVSIMIGPSVTTTDVLAGKSVMGYTKDGPNKDLWLPAARVLGYPIFTVHPEELDAGDQWRLRCDAVFEDLGLGDRPDRGKSAALYHARYSEVDLERAQEDVQRHADALNAAIAGEVVAGFRIHRVDVLVDNLAEALADSESRDRKKSVKGAKLSKSSSGATEIFEEDGEAF
ncbi:hypothetical protein DFJ74DRAFT_701059 [Hyaloraphidium curvatum]|nr:hypothetical protein DFJ74DRAFT_701059 [Hyaloraphidium curvatum]